MPRLGVPFLWAEKEEVERGEGRRAWKVLYCRKPNPNQMSPLISQVKGWSVPRRSFLWRKEAHGVSGRVGNVCTGLWCSSQMPWDTDHKEQVSEPLSSRASYNKEQPFLARGVRLILETVPSSKLPDTFQHSPHGKVPTNNIKECCWVVGFTRN